MKALCISFKNAFCGIYHFIRKGRNAKIQLLAAIIISVSGIILHFNTVEWFAVIICISSVLSLEAINSSIEVLADEISKEQKPSIRHIKDMAAGAVLIASLGSLVIATVIFSRHL